MDETLQKYKNIIENNLGNEVTWIGWSNEHFNIIEAVVKPTSTIKHISIRMYVEETKPI